MRQIHRHDLHLLQLVCCFDVLGRRDVLRARVRIVVGAALGVEYHGRTNRAESTISGEELIFKLLPREILQNTGV